MNMLIFKLCEISSLYFNKLCDAKEKLKRTVDIVSFDDWENIGFKKSSLSRVYLPRFHPVDKWISTVEFKSS